MMIIMHIFLIHSSTVTEVKIISQEQQDYLKVLQDLYLRLNSNNMTSIDHNIKLNNLVCNAFIKLELFIINEFSNSMSISHLSMSSVHENSHFDDLSLNS